MSEERKVPSRMTKSPRTDDKMFMDFMDAIIYKSMTDQQKIITEKYIRDLMLLASKDKSRSIVQTVGNLSGPLFSCGCVGCKCDVKTDTDGLSVFDLTRSFSSVPDIVLSDRDRSKSLIKTIVTFDIDPSEEDQLGDLLTLLGVDKSYVFDSEENQSTTVKGIIDVITKIQGVHNVNIEVVFSEEMKEKTGVVFLHKEINPDCVNTLFPTDRKLERDEGWTITQTGLKRTVKIMVNNKPCFDGCTFSRLGSLEKLLSKGSFTWENVKSSLLVIAFINSLSNGSLRRLYLET